MSAQISSPYYLTDGPFFMNGSNIISGIWNNVSNAFSKPVATHSTPVTGYDWTKPFPGTALSGYNVNLTISQEMHIPEDVVEDATTPKSMDPSWFVCRHVFISTKPEVKKAVEGGGACSFLSSACQSDLKTSLTQDWGQLDPTYMCGALAFDPIPSSCIDSFGSARQDVMAFNNMFLANATLTPAQVSSTQQCYSWRIGTEYHDPGSAEASTASSGIRKVPEVSFGCLSSGPAYVPPVEVPATSTTALASTPSKSSIIPSSVTTTSKSSTTSSSATTTSKSSATSSCTAIALATPKVSPCGVKANGIAVDGGGTLIAYSSGEFVANINVCAAKCMATATCTNVFFVSGKACNLHYGPIAYVVNNSGVNAYDLYAMSCFACSTCPNAGLATPAPVGSMCNIPANGIAKTGSGSLTSYAAGSPYVASIQACGTICMQTATCTNVLFVQGKACNLKYGALAYVLNNSGVNAYGLYHVSCFNCVY
ncbi:hypothetical protein DL95DRAFT_465442 [Leptodontidium sp. 2 PMI_412]|nr:hypothetical protein DL95DRAFT_465442 [Leptodontidium sp. 2 PMI_412]